LRQCYEQSLEAASEEEGQSAEIYALRSARRDPKDTFSRPRRLALVKANKQR
jgi:hypothetical protein